MTWRRKADLGRTFGFFARDERARADVKPLFAVLAIYAGCLAIVGLVSPGQSMPEPPEFTPPGNFGDAIIYPFVATWQVIMYVVKLMFSITVIGAPHIIGVMIGTIIIGWVAWDVASMIRGR